MNNTEPVEHSFYVNLKNGRIIGEVSLNLVGQSTEAELRKALETVFKQTTDIFVAELLK